MAIDMTFDELLNEMDYSEDDQVILRELRRNNWKIKETAQALHHGKKMISKYRKDARHDIPIWLWQHKNGTAQDAERIANIEHHSAIKVLQPLGYDTKAHYQVQGNSLKAQREKYLEEFGQKYANDQSLNADNLDDFIMTHRDDYAYDAVKQALYRHNSALQQRMFHQKTKVSAARLDEIKSNVQARNTFYNGLRLDFPEYTALQLRLLYFKDPRYPRSIHHYRNPSAEEQKEMVNRYVHGEATANHLADEYDLSYKAIVKVLKNAGVYDVYQPAQKTLRQSVSAKSLAKITPEQWQKGREKTRQKTNAKAQVPHDYLSSIPQWAWDLVSQQPEVLWFDKFYRFFRDKNKVLKFIKQAQQYYGSDVGLSDLDEIFPSLDYVSSPSKVIYDNFAQDQDIKQLTSNASDSHYETRLSTLFNQLHVAYEHNNRRLIAPHELDFYLPDSKLAFEISPIRTHNSNKYQHLFADPKSERYHYRKYQLCQRQGIRLITLFQNTLDEPTWTTVMKPMLKFLITGHAEHTYYARQTEVRPITKLEARSFLNRWHLNGATSGRFAYGVFAKDSDELLGAALFNRPMTPKYKAAGYLELKRLAWRSDVQVRYGLSKLIAQVQHDHRDEYTGLLSYSDNNIGDGASYQKAGFKLVKETGPQLTFVNPLHAEDHYSWSIATPWGAKSGVLAQAFGSQNITSNQARKLVEIDLPHRVDSGKGYAAQYDTGNKVWLKVFR